MRAFPLKHVADHTNYAIDMVCHIRCLRTKQTCFATNIFSAKSGITLWLQNLNMPIG